MRNNSKQTSKTCNSFRITISYETKLSYFDSNAKDNDCILIFAAYKNIEILSNATIQAINGTFKIVFYFTKLKKF